MNARTRAIAAIATLVLILGVAAGRRMHSSSLKRTEAAQSVNPYNLSGTSGPVMPDVSKIVGNQAAMFNLMNKYRLDPRVAMFVSQAKIEMISQSKTSVHYVLTFPNGVTSDEVITVTPHQKYTPTAAELQRLKHSGVQIFGPNLSVKRTGSGEALFTIHYYALQSSLPATFQPVIQESSSRSQSSGWGFFDFVPSVYAQEGGDNGSGVVTGEVMEFVKTEAVKGLEIAEKEKLAKFADNILTMKDLISGYKEISGWLGEIAELKDCAQHPTNPLTQKASDTAEYQQHVTGSLDDAAWDVQMAAFPKVANITAGALTQFMEGAFGAGLLVAPITAMNDEAIAAIMEDEIADARKGVTPCHHEQISDGQFRPMQANFKYEFNLKSPNQCYQGGSNCGQGEEKRGLTGTVHMTLDALGFLSGKGDGEITIQKSQHASNEYGCNSEWHETSKGLGEIELGAGGDSPQNGVVKAEFHSETLTTDGGSTPCKLPPTNWRHENGAIAIGCRFYNVNLVHGGTYSAFDNGDSHGTCTLEIFPQ